MRHYFAGIVKINRLRHRVAPRKTSNGRGTCLHKQINSLITLLELTRNTSIYYAPKLHSSTLANPAASNLLHWNRNLKIEIVRFNTQLLEMSYLTDFYCATNSYFVCRILKMRSKIDRINWCTDYMLNDNP